MATKNGKTKSMRQTQSRALAPIADSSDDLVVGFLGGAAGTNYGENNSLMAATCNYSTPVLIAAPGWTSCSLPSSVSCATPCLSFSKRPKSAADNRSIICKWYIGD